MSSQPTFKSLLRINLVITGVVSFLAFIFLLIANVDLRRASIIGVMGAVIILLVGTIDIYILGFRPLRHSTVRSGSRRKRWRYLVSFVTSPIVYFIIWSLFQPLLTKEENLSEISFVITIVLSSWLMNALIILLYNYNFLQHSKIQSELENLQLKATISETANQLLKQQIHPHFLFNVLNTVKTLYKQDINQGEAYLVHLANFLRASLSNPTARIVKLDDELQLCGDYIEMQRIRFGHALTCKIDLSSETRQRKFVPYFALQTLLENAIKHNDLTEEAPLNIHIVEEQNFVNVINNLQPRHFKEHSTGQGLFNLAERYRLLTGDEIRIVKSESQFKVSIKLLDNEDSNH